MRHRNRAESFSHTKQFRVEMAKVFIVKSITPLSKKGKLGEIGNKISLVLLT